MGLRAQRSVFLLYFHRKDSLRSCELPLIPYGIKNAYGNSPTRTLTTNILVRGYTCCFGGTCSFKTICISWGSLLASLRTEPALFYIPFSVGGIYKSVFLSLSIPSIVLFPFSFSIQFLYFIFLSPLGKVYHCLVDRLFSQRLRDLPDRKVG